MQRASRMYLSLLTTALFLAGCGYNQIQTLDERVNQAQGQIQTQLQRRADLIPNLVNTVKGVTKQEDTVFISIANARAGCPKADRDSVPACRSNRRGVCSWFLSWASWPAWSPVGVATRLMQWVWHRSVRSTKTVPWF